MTKSRDREGGERNRFGGWVCVNSERPSKHSGKGRLAGSV